MFWVKIAERENMAKNMLENILTQYDCSTAYRTTILTAFETEFKLGKSSDC